LTAAKIGLPPYEYLHKEMLLDPKHRRERKTGRGRSRAEKTKLSKIRCYEKYIE